MANNAYDVIDNQLTKMQEQLREQNAADAAETRAQIIGCLLTLEENRRKDSLRQFAKEQLDYVKSSVKEPDAELGAKVLDLTMKIVESETETREAEAVAEAEESEESEESVEE